MDTEQLRLQADLKGQIDGDVLCDDYHRQLYSSDASIYEVRPIGIVRPRHSGDVARAAWYASENGIPIYPRGGGTGLAGQSLGNGLILDFSKYMRRLIEVDAEARRVRVQPGLVLADLNRMLAKQGLIFGPDPAARAVTTMGSVIAVDAQGSHYPKYGSAGDWIQSLEAVLSNGDAVTLGKHVIHHDSRSPNELQQIASEVGSLLLATKSTLQKPTWDSSLRGCGFRLEKCLDGDVVDLARLQCGAEGTLSIITEATLRVAKLPSHRGVVLMFFDRMESAANCAMEIANTKLAAACDLMDRRLLELARETDARYDRYLRRGSEAMLLLECQGDDAAEMRSNLTTIISKMQRRFPSMVASRITSDSKERDFLWKLCRRVVQRLYRVKGADRPIPAMEDISVPVTKLADFLLAAQNIFKSKRLTATVFSHAVQGHVQLRPFVDLSDVEQRQIFQDVTREIYETVLQMKGVIAGETSFGLSRTWWARQQLGDRYPWHRRIKELFDPKNLLNPGKLITDAPQRLTDNLRSLPIAFAESDDSEIEVKPIRASQRTAVDKKAKRLQKRKSLESESEDLTAEPNADELQDLTRRDTILPILDWESVRAIGDAANACNGCGRCRTNAESERMCPVFRMQASEETSPRAMANLARGWLADQLPKQAATTDQMKGMVDQCFHCHQCRIDCPASVDIPRLMLEIKSQYVAANGLSYSDKFLSRLDRFATIANRFPRLANWALENQWCRWLFEKTTGVAASRKLPSVASTTFNKWAAKKRLTRPVTRGGTRRVLLFADQYTNWHNPLLGIAAAEILLKNRVEVYVPPMPLVSYMAKIVMGDGERTRKLITPQIQQLADAVRNGYKIVTIEPTTALCLQREYPFLINNEDSQLVAQNTTEIGRYLWDLHLTNELDLNLAPLPISVMYHLPCHLRAIDSEQPGLELLKLIPALQVIEASAGCSGMAGTFGLKRSNYRTSLRIGWPLIGKMQSTPVQVGSTECSTCKLQMEQAVEQPTVPPVALLAYSYGLTPQVGDWINRRNYGLTVQ